MERRAIAVQGVVQGVGFRPFVCGLAASLRLTGFVKNCVGDVLIEVEGDATSLDTFLKQLSTHPPPLARIEHLGWKSLRARETRSLSFMPATLTDLVSSSSRRTSPLAPTVCENCSTRPIAVTCILS